MESLLRFIHSSHNLPCLRARWPLNIQNTPTTTPAMGLDYFLHTKWKKTGFAVTVCISPFSLPWVFLQRQSPFSHTQMVRGQESGWGMLLCLRRPLWFQKRSRIWTPKLPPFLGFWESLCNLLVLYSPPAMLPTPPFKLINLQGLLWSLAFLFPQLLLLLASCSFPVPISLSRCCPNFLTGAEHFG